MKLELSNPDLVGAIKDWVKSQGLPNPVVDIEFKMGRKGSGLITNIVLGAVGDVEMGNSDTSEKSENSEKPSKDQVDKTEKVAKTEKPKVEKPKAEKTTKTAKPEKPKTDEAGSEETSEDKDGLFA